MFLHLGDFNLESFVILGDVKLQLCFALFEFGLTLGYLWFKVANKVVNFAFEPAGKVTLHG